MFFYKYILIIIIYLRDIKSDSNPELLFPEAGLEKPTPLAVGLIFYIRINNTSNENDFYVEITPDQCCLNENKGINCDCINILGGCTDFIEKGKTKILRVVAPLLDVYERNGHCTVYADSKTNYGQNNRDTIKINFDTTIENSIINFPENFEHCKHKDEDPFNKCKPVDCDTYYNGRKVYYSRKHKRCIEVPPCVSDNLDYPTVIYNPITNQCYENTLTKKDLRVLKKVNRHRGKGRKPKDVLIISKFQPNVTEFVNSVDLIDHVIKVTTSHPSIFFNNNPERNIKHNCLKLFWRRYFVDNRWTLVVLSFVITVQCFFICTMIYCLSKTCNCLEDKKVVRKFFNYRQDASVTTPLIGTSNIDTETDYQYLSDNSNNAELKIKCYKACQKENQNLKLSMSDDILSKCLNRRDWKKFKSEAITEVEKEKEIQDVENDFSNRKFLETEDIKKPDESKVVFEDENNTVEKIKSKAVSIVSNVEILNGMDDSNVETNISSEKEIICHNYCFDGISQSCKEKNCQDKVKKDPSISTEKGAQIYFSNDSIDDFLSERGMTSLIGENISKYTFSTEFNDLKPSSTISSKASKNFVKNVLSLLHKKTKGRSGSSDPGKKEDIDVKLIHMTKAPVYTSSNESNFGKILKRRDSR